jgi:hypothetical protein
MGSTAASAHQCVETRAEQSVKVVKQESSVASFSNLSDNVLPNDQSLPYFGTDPIPNWVYRRRGRHIVTKIADASDIADRSDFQPYTPWL